MNINFTDIFLKGIFESIKYTWQLYFLIGLVLAIKIIYFLFKYFRFRKAGLFEIDKMSGPDFERYLTTLFHRFGYKVSHVGSLAGDYGADLVIEKDGIKTVVQAKRYKGVVGIDSVRDAYGAVNYYKATKSMVVTNRYFTNQAKILAKSNNVILWDRNELAKNILASTS